MSLWSNRAARVAIFGRGAILCALAAGPVLILAFALRAESDLLDRARQAEETLSLYERRLASLPAPDASPDAQRPGAGSFVRGETLAVAGADLRRRVIAIVAATEGRVVESELMQVASDVEGADVVRLRVAVTGSNDAIQTILFDLEAMRPPVVLSALAIQSPGFSRAAADDEPVLTASLVLDGFWKADAP